MKMLEKNPWIIPVAVVLLVSWFVLKNTNFSVTGYIADKVVEKLEADYDPYGPNGAP